jgi:MoxR-like ATPase
MRNELARVLPGDRRRPPLARLEDALNGVILGKAGVVRHALTAVLAGGHILLEDVPGVGKTTLAQAIARGLGCSFRRIQFTSDLLPSDILGVHVFDAQRGTFELRPGPVFAHVVLADEINRTTPKTQSSLLEAMNEGQVSIDNETRPLPDPFLVIATQNPHEHHGTYPLPESQLDRFLIRLRLGYPEADVERELLRGRRGAGPVQALDAQLTLEELRALQAAVDDVRMDDVVLDYLMALVTETRRSPLLALGVSTRGALALQRAARAHALLDGRDFVLPDDVKSLAAPVLAHRLVVNGEADLRGRHEAERIVADLLQQLPVAI